MRLGESECSHLVSVSWMSWIIYLVGWSKLFYVVASVWDQYQKYNSERVQLRAERFVNSRYSRYSSVSDMLDVLGWLPFSQRRYEARLILFYQIINGLAKCPSNASLLRRIRILEEIIRSGSNDSRLHVMEPPRRRSFIWKIGVDSSIQDQHPFWPSFCVELVMRVNADSLLIRAATTSTSGTLNDGPDHGKQQKEEITIWNLDRLAIGLASMDSRFFA